MGSQVLLILFLVGLVPSCLCATLDVSSSKKSSGFHANIDDPPGGESDVNVLNVNQGCCIGGSGSAQDAPTTEAGSKSPTGPTTTTTTTTSTTATTTYPAFRAEPWIMRAGGYNKGREKTCQLISLEPTTPIPNCLKSIADFPFSFYHGFGASTSAGPLVCGGYGDNRRQVKCHVYNASAGAWEETSGRLSFGRIRGAYSSHPSLGLVLTGGLNGSSLAGTVESTVDGVVIESERFKPMPEPLFEHCQLFLDYDTLLVMGGRNDTAYRTITEFIYKLSLSSNEWSVFARLPTPRALVQCGLASDSNTRYLIVSGGQPASGGFSGKVEALDLQTMQWSEKKTFVFRELVEAASVPVGRDTFLVVGGSIRDHGVTDYVRGYDAAADSWGAEGRLHRPLYGVTAFTVDPNFFPKCP